MNCEAVHTAIEKVAEGLDPNGPEILSDLKCRARGPDGELDPNGAVFCMPGDPTYDMQTDWAFIQGNQSSSFFTPKVTIDWAPNDDRLFYLSWARAQKPAGINQLTGSPVPVLIENERFDSERMDSYEFGAKTAWELGGALQLNGAIFFQDYTDKQVGTQELIDGFLAPKVINAAAAEVWGLELEVIWSPEVFEGLSLSAAYTYLDAEYVDFFDDTASVVRAGSTGRCELVEKGESYFCRMDLSGNQLERTPENSFVGTINVQRQLMDNPFDWFLALNATFEDERFLSADNFVRWDSYWLVDLRAGLAGEKCDLTFYVDNLLDDDTLRSGGSGPDIGLQLQELGFVAGLGVSHYFSPLPPPRTLGVRLSLRF